MDLLNDIIQHFGKHLSLIVPYCFKVTSPALFIIFYKLDKDKKTVEPIEAAFIKALNHLVWFAQGQLYLANQIFGLPRKHQWK